jgi:hypothetical protein
MTDYGKGAVLAAATSLPATAAFGIALLDNIHPAIVTGFIIVNVIWFVLVVASISRYLVNRRDK